MQQGEQSKPTPNRSPDRRPDRRTLLGLAAAAGGAFLLSATGCSSGNRTTRAFRDREPLPPPRDPYQARRTPNRDRRPLGPFDEPGVIARSSWTASPPVRHLADPMHGISRITVHHDGMSVFESTSQTEAEQRLELVRQAHRGLGWADIGYHYAIDPAGRIYACRPLDLQGAHVKDHNEHNLGVVVLGNYERQQPTDATVRSLQGFLAARMHAYGVRPGRVYTHQELRPTQCPGRSLQMRMVEARRFGGALASL